MVTTFLSKLSQPSVGLSVARQLWQLETSWHRASPTLNLVYEDILVYQNCHNKKAQTCWLKQQKFIFSQFQKLEFQTFKIQVLPGLVVRKIMFPDSPLASGELVAILDVPQLVEVSCLHFHMVSPCVSVSKYPPFKMTPVILDLATHSPH